MNTIDYLGKTVKFEDAFIITDADSGDCFKANGEDDEGNEYEIYWEILLGREEYEDQSLMCDWDEPELIIKLS